MGEREVDFMEVEGSLGDFWLFNEKGIFKQLRGRLSYREKAIWTISYFQDSGNNKVYLYFLGRKNFLDRNL
jgi:hypothetical protein